MNVYTGKSKGIEPKKYKPSHFDERVFYLYGHCFNTGDKNEGEGIERIDFSGIVFFLIINVFRVTASGHEEADNKAVTVAGHEQPFCVSCLFRQEYFQRLYRGMMRNRGPCQLPRSVCPLLFRHHGQSL